MRQGERATSLNTSLGSWYALAAVTRRVGLVESTGGSPAGAVLLLSVERRDSK